MAKPRPPGRRACRVQGPDQLTTADLIVLSLLVEKPMHGYELTAEYERQEVADWALVSKAQVYYALQKLQAMHHIEPVPDEDDSSGVRERTVYGPTDAGRKALTGALSNTDWARTRLPQPFLTWVGLSIHADRPGAKAMIAASAAFLQREIEREQAGLHCIGGITCPRARVGEAVMHLTILQMQTELEWLSELRRCVGRASATG